MAHTLRSRDVCDSLSHSPHRAHTRDSQSGTHTLHTRCAHQNVQWQAVIKPSRRRVVQGRACGGAAAAAAAAAAAMAAAAATVDAGAAGVGFGTGFGKREALYGLLTVDHAPG